MMPRLPDIYADIISAVPEFINAEFYFASYQR
jgi:hypothetical protein